jgi:HNH endonuclease
MKNCARCNLVPRETGSYCRRCGSEQRKEYYEKNKDRITEYKKGYREKNRESIQTYNKKYRQGNSELVRKKDAALRERYRIRWKNEEPSREGTKWCCDCKSQVSRTKFTKNITSSEGLCTTCNECKTSRNSKKRTGHVGSHTIREWNNLRKRYNGFCGYCDVNEGSTKDHFHPCTPKVGEVRGTDNILNIIPACPSCNRSKGNKNPYKWIRDKFGSSHPLLDFDGEHQLNRQP